MKKKYTHRIKYFSKDTNELVTTGLMPKHDAHIVAEALKLRHDKVEVYEDSEATP